jgi:hypothetical protein
MRVRHRHGLESQIAQCHRDARRRTFGRHCQSSEPQTGQGKIGRSEPRCLSAVADSVTDTTIAGDGSIRCVSTMIREPVPGWRLRSIMMPAAARPSDDCVSSFDSLVASAARPGRMACSSADVPDHVPPLPLSSVTRALAKTIPSVDTGARPRPAPRHQRRLQQSRDHLRLGDGLTGGVLSAQPSRVTVGNLPDAVLKSSQAIYAITRRPKPRKPMMSRSSAVPTLHDDKAFDALPEAMRILDDLLAAAEEAFKYAQARHPIDVSGWGLRHRCFPR